MKEFTIHDFISESEKQQEFYREQISKFDKILSDYSEKAADLKIRRMGILNNITHHFIPELTQDYLEKASQKINSPKLATLYNEFLKDKNDFKSKIEAIEKINDYIKRDSLTDPESGVIPSQINEIKPIFESAKSLCNKINQFPSFKGLKDRNFGTNSYPYQGFKKYFIPQYYQDWKNSDLMIEKLGVKYFVDILHQYNEAEVQVKTLGTALDDYQKQISNIKQLATDHDSALEKLSKLDNTYYDIIGNLLFDFFTSTDKLTLQKFFEGKTELENEYTKIDGIEHQIEYINSLAEKVTNDRNILVNKAGKLSEESQRYKINEYKFRNKKFSEQQFESKFARDESKYNKMYDRYDRYGETVYGFNDYGRSSLISNFLWWDLISDGRLDGNFIPEVQEYHSSNPDYVYEPTSSGTESGSNSDQS